MGSPDGAADPTALTISEAAQACRVHRNTIRRHLDRNDFPGAYRDEETRAWYIPVSDLEATGLRPNRFVAEPVELQPVPMDAKASLLAERESLLARQAELSRRAEVAEAVGHERAERLEDLQNALALLRSVRAGRLDPPVVQPAPWPAGRSSPMLLLVAVTLLFGIGVVLAIAVPISAPARAIALALVAGFGASAALYFMTESRGRRSTASTAGGDPAGQRAGTESTETR